SHRPLAEPPKEVAKALTDRGAPRPGVMHALETLQLPRRCPPDFICNSPNLSREGERLDAHRNTGQRDSDLQSRFGMAGHRAAAVDDEHESRRPHRAAEPPRCERLAAGLQAGSQGASEGETAPALRRPPATR